MPVVESERLPKEAAGPGLTSTLLPPNLEEETQQHEKQRTYSENLTGQAGQTTSDIGNSMAGPGRRHMVLWILCDTLARWLEAVSSTLLV